jgi:hypothetical protein
LDERATQVRKEIKIVLNKWGRILLKSEPRLVVAYGYWRYRYLIFLRVRLLSNNPHLDKHGVESHCVQIVHYHLSFTGVY